MFKMECQYCKTILKTNSALKQHQTKTKYCLKLQGKDGEKGTFICRGCDKDFHQKSNLTIHIKTCESYKPENLLKRIDILEKNKNNWLEEKKILIQEKKEWLQEKKDLVKSHTDLIQTLAKNHSYKENIIIEIDDDEDISDENKDDEEYKLLPLELG